MTGTILRAVEGSGKIHRCLCGSELSIEIELGSEPWPETGREFTGYAEHWICPEHGELLVVQVPQ